jgi:hypothetical protein
MTEPTTTATGATPGAGATPAQAEGNGAAAGATPAATAAKDAATAAQPATGEEALGDAGKAVLSQARREAKEAKDQAAALQRQLEELQAGTQSDHEKATAAAVREATASERAKWQARIREAEVRGALRGAGVTNERLLGLFINAPEIRELKVDNETGEVDGVAEAIEKVKKDYPEVFSTKTEPGPGGSWGGAEGSSSRKPQNLEEAVNAEIQKQYQTKR